MVSVMRGSLLGVGLLGLVLPACAAGPDPSAFRNEVFYASGRVSAENRSQFESLYPPFDLPVRAPGYVGVGVLQGAVHLSRPRDWVIRSASNTPHDRFIEYASPNEYVVAIHERLESPNDTWSTVLGRYEKDLERTGAKPLGKGVPVASFHNQGRAYSVERPVPAPKTPLVGKSREYLFRSEDRLVLVQIVFTRDSLEPIADELVPVLDSLKVD
jgi:hypothetical protein